MKSRGDAASSPADFYDTLGDGYEHMIDWDSRLAREGPFFKKLFGDNKVQSVLDIACGTGRHAIEFARWGLDAAGCDISSEMIRLARRNATGKGVKVDFFKAGMSDFNARARKFDAVLCIGNSLPHLLTQRELGRTMRLVKRVLSPGGVFVSQVRNYERILRDNLRFMPPTSAEIGGNEIVFFRMLDIYGSRRVDFHIVRMVKKSGRWTHTVQTTRLRPLTRQHIGAALERAGFRRIIHYSDYYLQRFGVNKTMDLMTVAS